MVEHKDVVVSLAGRNGELASLVAVGEMSGDWDDGCKAVVVYKALWWASREEVLLEIFREQWQWVWWLLGGLDALFGLVHVAFRSGCGVWDVLLESDRGKSREVGQEVLLDGSKESRWYRGEQGGMAVGNNSCWSISWGGAAQVGSMGVGGGSGS